MESNPAQNITISQLLRATGFLSLVILAVWWGWARGRKDNTAPEQAENVFRVAGSSMVPAFYGPSIEARCMVCEQSTRVDPLSVGYPEHQTRCLLCGGQLDCTGEVAPGDTVQVAPATAPYGIGDAVAINVDGQFRIKRIAAMPGDTVDVRGDRITVNGQRIEHQMRLHAEPAMLLVDDNSLRQASRWSPVGDWLVYRHTNVRNPQQPITVLDDYQFNTGVIRQLNDVEALAAEVHSQAGLSSHEIQFAFWSPAGIRTSTCPMSAVAKSNSLAAQPLENSAATAKSAPPITADSPIAIKFAGSSDRITALRVLRYVEYRLRKSDSRAMYPLTIPADKCFVLGDNVPVSIDSRELGTVAISTIIGRVTKVDWDLGN